jgi:hypothetical protein
MKRIIILSLSTLVVWFLITRLEPNDGTVTLNEDTLNQMNKEFYFQRILWIILLVLETVLAYSLYKIIPKVEAGLKIGVKVYLSVIFLILILSMMIFIVGLTSF